MKHFEVKQGDDYSTVLTVTTQAGAVVNLTGATLTFHLREFGQTTDALTVVLTPLVAASGTATLALTDAQTAALSPSKAYSYEVELVDSLGLISTPVEGRVYVRPDRG